MCRRFGLRAGMLLGAATASACGPPPSSPMLAGHAAGPPARPAASAPAPTPVAPPAGSALPSGPTGAVEAPPLEADWGGAGPVALAAASPDGRWLALCEARLDTNGDGRVTSEIGRDGTLTGDRLAGYYVEGGGPGDTIDAYVGSDPSGRWVALVRAGKLHLRDTVTATETILEADLREDPASFGPSRLAAFDSTGRRVLYHRSAPGRARVIVRELESGRETEIDPGPGDPFRAEFDSTGEWVLVRVAIDSSGNGRIDWPAPPVAPFMRCELPAPRFAAFTAGADSWVPRAARVQQGATARDAPGLIAPFGAGLVVREADGALVLVGQDGSRRRLVEPACAGKVLHAAPVRDALLVTCQKKNGRLDARLLTGGRSQALGIELGVAPQDRVLPGAPERVALHPGSDAVLVDLAGGRVEKLRKGDRVVATAGARALVLRGQRLITRGEDGAEAELPGEITPFGNVLRAGNVVAVAPSVVDVGTASFLGTFAGRPLAVATDGRLLTPQGRGADARSLAVGPLRWIPPATSP